MLLFISPDKNNMRLNISKTTILLTIFFLLGLPVLSAAQESSGVFTLTADKLPSGEAVELDKAGWKYHAGDDANWAKAEFDDAGWETLDDAALTSQNMPQTLWNGIGWFRLHLKAAPELADVPLNLEVGHFGASEIYLDGKLIKRLRHGRRECRQRNAVQSERRTFEHHIQRHGQSHARRPLLESGSGKCEFRIRQMV